MALMASKSLWGLLGILLFILSCHIVGFQFHHLYYGCGLTGDLSLAGTLSKAFTTFTATDSGVCFGFSAMLTSSYERRISIVPACGVAMLQAEHAAGSSCSASCYEATEHIGVFAMVMTEREFRQVEREILAADLMEAANDATFQQCPERFNRVRMDVPAHVFLSGVIDYSRAPIRDGDRRDSRQ